MPDPKMVQPRGKWQVEATTVEGHEFGPLMDRDAEPELSDDVGREKVWGTEAGDLLQGEIVADVDDADGDRRLEGDRNEVRAVVGGLALLGAGSLDGGLGGEQFAGVLDAGQQVAVGHALGVDHEKRGPGRGLGRGAGVMDIDGHRGLREIFVANWQDRAFSRAGQCP